ncbi:hypothetical protein [Methanocaldococcus jannaschii]|nr:hypothetical protein [Methanocaldococcus jannaschii]
MEDANLWIFFTAMLMYGLLIIAFAVLNYWLFKKPVKDASKE